MKPKQKTARDVRFAEGGSDKMVRPQAAGPAPAGRTGKMFSAASGKRAATGGSRTSSAPALATPSKPGRTAPVKGR
jgi:hypothetical protein